MSNILKKISLIGIIFLISLLLLGQINVKAQSYNPRLSSGSSYYVNLSGGSSPFYITAGGTPIFCNQHGASLRNSTYTFQKANGWLSNQDAMAYIFSEYGKEYIDSKFAQQAPSGELKESEEDYSGVYRSLQRVVWNINAINSLINREIESYEGTHSSDLGQTEGNDNQHFNEEWADEVETISYAALDSVGNKLANEALQYMMLQKDIEQNGGKYKCDVEKITSDPVAVNTDENTYIIGSFRVNYSTYEINDKKLADIKSIDVVDIETGNKLQNIKFQCAEENGDTNANVKNGDIYPDGTLPSDGCKFNIILPYNNNENVEKINLIVNYEYLAYCEAQFTPWLLGGHGNAYGYAWQKQLTFDGGYRQWVTGSTQIDDQITPWTFELQKRGKENGQPLSNVKFEITFYDVNGTVKRDTQMYTTNSNGIIQIPGLDFYGDLKIKIQEVGTNDGYQLDNTEKWIQFHKDNGPVNKFTDIIYNEEEIVEVNGNDAFKLTALIQNNQKGFNFDIIKIDSSTEKKLSGAQFTVRLEKIGIFKTETVYYKEKLNSPVISITEQDIIEYLGENQINYNYNLEGKYIAYITETKTPNYYYQHLLNKDITVEFEVNRKFFSSEYEINNLEVSADLSNNRNIETYVDFEDNSTRETASLSLYIKNQRRAGGRWK